MYGAQTFSTIEKIRIKFENDVEMYGAQTFFSKFITIVRLRMM